MKPATIDADMSNVDGQPVTVDVGDFDMRLADSDERGVFRDNAEWNGAVYYTVLALKDSTFVEFDGGTFQYEKDTDLSDLLRFALVQVIRASAWSRGAVA